MFEILALSFMLSAGVEREMWQFGPEFYGAEEFYYFTKLGATWNPLPWFGVYGSVKTDFVADTDSIYFLPFHNTYILGAKIHVGNFEIGAEHLCAHTQVVTGAVYGQRYDRARERIYIKGEW